MGRSSPVGVKDPKGLGGMAKPEVDGGVRGPTADPLDADKLARTSKDADADNGDADNGDAKGEGTAAPEVSPRDDADDLDRLDPSARHAAHLAAPGGFAPMPSAIDTANATPEAPVRARSLEELLPLLVRKIAWAGDRQKGTVRLELGAGAYAGTTVVVHADAGRVRVEIGGNEGPELERLRGRLDARLRRHGLDVESVT